MVEVVVGGGVRAWRKGGDTGGREKGEGGRRIGERRGEG